MVSGMVPGWYQGRFMVIWYHFEKATQNGHILPCVMLTKVFLAITVSGNAQLVLFVNCHITLGLFLGL